MNKCIFSSWFKGRDLRVPRCFGQMVNVKERLFMCGGASGSDDINSSTISSLSSIDEYDFIKDDWVCVTDMEVPRHDMGVAVVGTQLFITFHLLYISEYW